MFFCFMYNENSDNKNAHVKAFATREDALQWGRDRYIETGYDYFVSIGAHKITRSYEPAVLPLRPPAIVQPNLLTDGV